MSGSGDLQPNSGLRYHTDADSPLPETINPIIDVVETNSATIASHMAKTIKHIEGEMFGANTSREFVLGTGTYLMISKGNNNAPSYFELIGVIDSVSTHESIVPVNDRASIVYEGNKITVTHVGWGTCRIIQIN